MLLILMGNSACGPITGDTEHAARILAALAGNANSPIEFRNRRSSKARRFSVTGSDGSRTGTANFQGNFTAVSVPTQGLFLLARLKDCSLDLITVNDDSDPGSLTAHYEQTLHQLAGLQSTPGIFPHGCEDKNTGISSRPGVGVGSTQNGVLVFAAIDVSGPLIYNSNNTVTEVPVPSLPSASGLATSDFDGDLNGDLVVVNGNGAGSAFVSVLLGNPDGTFKPPVDYPTAGDFSMAAVIDDVNQDGKLDIVVVSADSAAAAGQQISVFLGNGDGSFQSARSFAVPSLPGSAHPASTPIVNLITADVNGDGKQDIVGSNGLVLLGNGDGTFARVFTAAFPFTQATSNEGPNLASGDLNNDGKLDLVVSTGSAITIWMGNGDGTFTEGAGYASINDTGFISVTDFDGDGNNDIYVGLANGGVFAGDDYTLTSSYFLMGSGDGTFRGAPTVNGARGNKLVDLDGDGIPDLLSLTGPQSSGGATFTTALGTGNGSFTAASSITVPDSFTLNGFNFTGVSAAEVTSYATEDVNGDGAADLVFVDNGLTAINPGSGLPITYPYPVYFVALGHGDGTFQTPIPYAFPQIAPASGFDNLLNVDGLQIDDLNKDGHNDLIFTYNDQAGGTGVNPYLQGFVVLAGIGDGTFSTTPSLTSTYSSGTPPTTAKLEQVTNTADLDGDGIPDLVVVVPTFSISDGATTQLNVFVGNGDGTFMSPIPVVSANAYGLPALADFNNDGKFDLAFLAETSSGQAALAISLGNGDGTFGGAAMLNVAGGDAIRSAGIAAADFDGDGNVDLALFDNSDFSGIFYGHGDGTFTSVPLAGNRVPKDLLYLSGGAPAVAVDLNKDGKPDIFAGSVALINSPAPAVTTPMATTTTLTASAATIPAGTSITFTASVAQTSGTGTPTGSATFLDGATSLGTGTLSAGTATFSTSSLSVGTHSITASYGGDSDNAPSTSTAISVAVTAVTPADFSIALSPASGTASAGGVATSTITVTPSGGFNQPVTFACSGLPKNALCSFSASPLSLDGSHSATSTITVTLPTAGATWNQVLPPSQGLAPTITIALTLLGPGLLGLTLLCCQKRIRRYLQLALAGAACAGFATFGCGGSRSQPSPATYQITITGTAGSTAHSAIYKLTLK